MDGFKKKACLVGIVLVVVFCGVAAVVADLADVYLKSGLRLRGDVTTTDDEVILHNAAGELHLPRADVERVVPVAPPASLPSSQPTSAPGLGGEKPDEKALDEAGAAPAKDARSGQLPPAPPLSKADIQRLRRRELLLDGPAELVQVKFEKKGRQRDLPTEVLEELRKRPDFQSEWEQVLTRGRPHEKVQLILRETGEKYADRIRITSDPEVFSTYRRRVLPLVNKSCARSGCHAGTAARVFRFPLGSKTSETYAYTSFVLLDQMRSRHGALLDRSSPEAGSLVYYMLPQDASEYGHPAVGRGPSFKPVLRSLDDPRYIEVVDWISYLMLPRPDYGLEYDNPYAGRVLPPPAEPEEEEEPEQAGEKPEED
ncbi:MAG: hypothetical protein KAY37_07100 [Phycisphaerae bacterium]|nr:hypothetical protein [Phycisphaerae bacterium]